MAESVSRIAIFASGTGTNADRLMQHFSERPGYEVVLLLSNRSSAGALERAEKHGVPTRVFNRETFYQTEHILTELKDRKVDWIVLAGFLWLIPNNLTRAFPNRIVNIHPALLPDFGGKGMYGAHVHRAVREAGRKQSGITIHYVNEKYDDGAIIFQAACKLAPEDDESDIAAKVQQLEHRYFPLVIERIARPSSQL